MAKRATVSLYEAKTGLSRLVDRALRGEEVVITRHGRPVARLLPAKPDRRPRKLGALRGKIRIARNFDAPLPDELQAGFEGRRS
jgi:prevent-host-death family protein